MPVSAVARRRRSPRLVERSLLLAALALVFAGALSRVAGLDADADARAGARRWRRCAGRAAVARGVHSRRRSRCGPRAHALGGGAAPCSLSSHLSSHSRARRSSRASPGTRSAATPATYWARRSRARKWRSCFRFPQRDPPGAPMPLAPPRRRRAAPRRRPPA